MRNILDFQEYREKVRLYEESLVQEQIMEPIEEGLFKNIRKKINQKATIFVRQALADEIEMGKKLNEEIQTAVDKLKEAIDEVQKYADEHGPKKSKLFKEIQKIFDDIHKASFDLLEILSGIEINFADYVQNATMATFVNFGVLFIPTRSTFLLKKSYKYFIGLIKNTIRRDMLMLMLNFDQFENTVLIQSLEDDTYGRDLDEYQTKLNAYEDFYNAVLMSKGKKKVDKSINDAYKALRDLAKMKQQNIDRRWNSIGFDTKYDNTYTKTLDQLKNYVLEDDSKYLEAIKKGMMTQALDEVDTKAYVELLISAAEECAYEVSNAIHTNFIEKVSVFKLANQKTLIELVKKDKERVEKELEEKRKDEADELKKMGKEKYEKAVADKGKEIFTKVIKGKGVKGGEYDSEYESVGGKSLAAFDKLGKVEYEGEEYDEDSILLSWLAVDGFKNWEKQKDKIPPLLKLVLGDMGGRNKDCYSGKYTEFLMDTFPSFIVKNYEKKKGKEAPDKIRNSYYARLNNEDSTYVDILADIIAKKKGTSEPEPSEPESEEPKTSTSAIAKKTDGKMEVDGDKEKVLRKALELISENTMEISDTHIKRIVEITKKLCDKPLVFEYRGSRENGFGVELEPDELKKLEGISENLVRKELSEGDTEESPTKK